MTSKEAKELRDKYYFDLGIYRFYNRNKKLFHTTLKVLFGVAALFTVLAAIVDPHAVTKLIWPAVYAGIGFIAIIVFGAIDHFVFIGRSKRIIMKQINKHLLLPWGVPHSISWKKFCELAEIK